MRRTVIILSLLACALCAGAGEPVRFSARAGLEVARDAAASWAPDAQLVYLENDEMVGPDGQAIRWGYLFYSPLKAKARSYSVRDGKILEAADLSFDFEPVPLSEDWIDSHAARVAAEQKAGEKYCREFNGHLATMLLIRGAFHEKKPDATTWALVYEAAAQPPLFVIVDASNGDVVRTLRG
jgi:dipeptidyl aminopeptidase/acylaminoacyl peptidase